MQSIFKVYGAAVALRMAVLLLISMLVLIMIPVGSGDLVQGDRDALLAFKKNVTLDQLDCTHNWNLTGFDPCNSDYPYPYIKCDTNKTRVTQIDLRGCNILVSLVPELAKLTMLTQLSLSTNALTGNIPRELGKLVNLQILSLEDNFMEGPIPEELGSLTKLIHMNLSSNDLNGTIPAALGNLNKLEKLSLGNNLLNGTIPKELIKLRELNILDLRSNNLSGIVKGFNFKRIQTVDMTNNYYLNGNCANTICTYGCPMHDDKCKP